MRFKEYLNESGSEWITDRDKAINWLRRNSPDNDPRNKFSYNYLIAKEDGSFSVIGSPADAKTMLRLGSRGHPIPKIRIRFTETNDLSMPYVGLETMEGFPRVVNGDLNLTNNKLTNFEYAPEKIYGNAMFYGNPITSLEGVHDHIKEIRGHINIPGTIVKGGLGLLHIDGLNSIHSVVRFVAQNEQQERLNQAIEIIEKYLEKPGSLFDCQAELIENDLEEFATL